jgi:uncharacterized protein with von Willebrand factor type A (vWA) domain
MADISSYSGLTGNPRAAEPGGSAAERILARYTHDEQRVILHNLETLAATAQFMGQDFSMRVLLNEPGKGWHWDFQRNEVRVDPETMLRAPIDVSRAIYCHEGFHRRITPKDGVPEGEWREPGLPFLVNSIEDPRIENFGGEAYPAYRPLRDASYRHSIGEATDAAKQTLGRAPRHVQAGLEIIHQWFREVEGKPFEIPVALDPSIRAFLEKALPHAQDAWLRYPTRDEVDWEPEKTALYFKVAYEIIRREIWPEFKRLYEEDRRDQLLDEAMRDLQGGGAPGAGGGSDGPAESAEPLTEGEVRELLKAAKEGKLKVGEGDPGNARPLDLSKLPPDLQREIAEFVDGLGAEEREKLTERGDARLLEASKAAAEVLEGRAAELGTPSTGTASDPSGELPPSATSTEPSAEFSGIDLSELRRHVTIAPEETAKIHAEFQHVLNEDRGLYHNTVREIAPTINQLENDLRGIFQRRRQSHRESGRRSGPTLDVDRFIRERSAGKAPIETRAFEVKTKPLEKDYAVVVLVDVSGSMRGKIHHAFAAAVACTEVLSRLKIPHAILGFNDALYRYKTFDEETAPAKLESIESAVTTPAAQYNNDGWALTEAVKTLRAAPEREKILIVLSDGLPVPSPAYASSEFDLKRVAGAVEQDGKVRLIGLGMGAGTEHVSDFYKNARANIPIEDLPHELSTVIKEAIGR